MRAAVCPAYGPPEVVRVEQRDAPTPGPGQVAVRVQASGVNFPDVLLIADGYQISLPTPFVPGSEFTGVVDEVGAGVMDIAVGDRVTGTAMCGAFADLVVVDAANVAPVPGGLDALAAAASGVAYRTAHHALRSMARLSEGDELVVLGAGGGVGLAAVQLGVAFGAHVTAVASSREKLDAAQQYGACRAIDHRDGQLRASLRAALPDGAHAVIDPVGGELSEPALRALRRGGRFVTVGFASGTVPRIPLNLVLLKGVHLLGFQFQDVPAEEFARNEDELRGLLSSRRVTPHVGAVYALEDVVAALRHVAEGRAVGKVVLDLT